MSIYRVNDQTEVESIEENWTSEVSKDLLPTKAVALSTQFKVDNEKALDRSSSRSTAAASAITSPQVRISGRAGRLKQCFSHRETNKSTRAELAAAPIAF